MPEKSIAGQRTNGLSPGQHHAQPHPDRARQFMPFAALRGYYDLVRVQERRAQPRHELTEEEAAALDERLAALSKGDLARVTHYDKDAYIETYGAITQIDCVFRTLTVVKTDIAFDDIWRIE